MPKTTVADVIVPEVFNPYVVQQTAELSALYQSGIVATSDELNSLAASGGRLINMPFWNDLDGDDEVLSDTSPLNVNKITSGQDIAVLLMRGKAWSVNDLAKALSGDDPMAMIGQMVAGYWARRMQVTLLSILKGVFASSSMAANVYDTNERISADNTILAIQCLGDAKSKLTGFLMHSAVEADLARQDLIEFVKDSTASVEIPTYLGKRVIVDDGCPVENGVYTTYIFGQGAIGYGEGAAPVPTETARDALSGDDILVSRRHFILHPRGVRWLDQVVAGRSPNNANLANRANWKRVYEPKNVRIVKYTHTIGSPVAIPSGD
jgi:hypothetical protein